MIRSHNSLVTSNNRGTSLLTEIFLNISGLLNSCVEEPCPGNWITIGTTKIFTVGQLDSLFHSQHVPKFVVLICVKNDVLVDIFGTKENGN